MENNKVVEFFGNLNLTILPANVAEYIKTQIIADNDISLIADDDEDFVEVKNFIEENYPLAIAKSGTEVPVIEQPAAPSEPIVEEPVIEEPKPKTISEQIGEIEGLIGGYKLKMGRAKGEDKERYKDTIAGFELKLKRLKAKKESGGDVVVASTSYSRPEDKKIPSTEVIDFSLSSNDPSHMADGGGIQDLDSLRNHVHNHVSSGYIGSRLYDLGYKDGLEYRAIDKVRAKMIDILIEHGDKEYSVSNLNKLISDAAIIQLGKPTNLESSHVGAMKKLKDGGGIPHVYDADSYEDARQAIEGEFSNEKIEDSFTAEDVKYLASIVHKMREEDVEPLDIWESNEVQNYLTNLSAKYKNKSSENMDSPEYAKSHREWEATVAADKLPEIGDMVDTRGWTLYARSGNDGKTEKGFNKLAKKADDLMKSGDFVAIITEDAEQYYLRTRETKSQVDETRIYAKGGGFEKLSREVSKEYFGQHVPKKYQSEYGKTYTKEGAEEVGKRVAAKVYRKQQSH